MNKTIKKIVSAVTASAFALTVFATPALATTTIEISGNGSGSDNWTTVSQNNTTVVEQNNNAVVSNNVTANSTSGNNSTNFNTGGQVLVGTGDAIVETQISNTLNSNVADVDCCDAGDTEVLISGNGANSENGVLLEQGATTGVSQDNRASVRNYVDANANTGGNHAVKNTGGDVMVGTGDAKVASAVSTLANVNVAHVGSSHMPSNPSASFVISGNGAGSDNYITAALAKLTAVDQDNSAYVKNHVDADANSGRNKADFNTGGDVVIGTGHAVVLAEVDNAVNFNHASVDCGCTWDVHAKISGNGAAYEAPHKWSRWFSKYNRPDNIISLTLDSQQLVGQGNNAKLFNDVDGYAQTGKNQALSNTGEADSDPAIMTGDSYVYSGAENTGNVNSAGSLPMEWPSFDWPDFGNVQFSFNMAAMMSIFGWFMS